MSDVKPAKKGIYLGRKRLSQRWNFIIKISGEAPHLSTEIIDIENFGEEVELEEEKNIVEYSSDILENLTNLSEKEKKENNYPI